jgi:hypothetical protein
LLWTAYEGRSLPRFQRGERGSRSNIQLDIFLKLVTGQIKSTNPFSTLEQAIRFYGLCNSLREQDFDLIKHILEFLVQYKILNVEQRSGLRSEISLRIPAKREAKIAKLGRAQNEKEEALAKRVAEEQEEERFWNDPEVVAEVARAEVAHLEANLHPPLQELVVLAGPPGGSDSAMPPVEPLEKGHLPSRVRIPAEELALIVAFRQALDNKDNVNWQAYVGLRKFDRLGLAAILDLADLVENDTLPCAVCGHCISAHSDYICQARSPSYFPNNPS